MEFEIDDSWADYIERCNIPTGHGNKNLRFCPGYCNICNEKYDVLLHIHAEKHGYADAYEMIADGVVTFDDKKLDKAVKECLNENKNKQDKEYLRNLLKNYRIR